MERCRKVDGRGSLGASKPTIDPVLSTFGSKELGDWPKRLGAAQKENSSGIEAVVK